MLCNNLAAALEELGAPREADALYRRALIICEANFPPSHPRVKHILDKREKLQSVLFTFPGLRTR